MLKVDELTKIMAALAVQSEKLRAAHDRAKLRNRKHAEAYKAAGENIAVAMRYLAELV